jgi:L-ascorbate metabolism protein UlaG (beta-lactamase superfamily)
MAHLRRVVGKPAEIAGKVDAVLVSHVHFDHIDLPSLHLVRSAQRVVPHGAGRLLRRRGFDAVSEIGEAEEVSIGPVSVRATHAEHRARRSPFAARVPALGFVISGSVRVYFAGDTDLFPAMRDLGPRLDLALLPIGGWGPRIPAGHMNPQRAAEALVLLQPRFAIPIHWGTYVRLGLSRDEAVLYEPAARFQRLAAEFAPDVVVRILSPGESFRIPRTP